MTDATEHERRITDFREAAQQVLEYTEDALVRRKELGTAGGFEELRPRFQRILERFQRLATCRLDVVPFEVLAALSRDAHQALSLFNRIKDFSPQTPNEQAIRREIRSKIEKFDEESYRQAAVVFATERATDEELEKARESLVQEIKAVSGVRAEAEQALQETQEVLAEARAVVAEAGVSQHAMHFKEAANEYDKSGKRWLAATVLAAVVALGYTGLLLHLYLAYRDPRMAAGDSIQLAIVKLLPLSILYFGVVWCAKNYRSQRHNYVVSKHRHDALSTFEAFVKAASDDQTKNAVLIQATQAIFSPQASGFVSQDSEGAQTPQLIELFRNVTGPDKRGT